MAKAATKGTGRAMRSLERLSPLRWLWERLRIAFASYQLTRKARRLRNYREQTEEESDWTTIVDDLFTTHPHLCHNGVVWSSFDIWLIGNFVDYLLETSP